HRPMVLLDWLSWLISFLIDTQNSIFVLMFMLTCSFGLSLERSFRYLLARRQSRAFIRETVAAFCRCEIHEVFFVAHRKPYSHVAVVVAAGLEHFESVSSLLPHVEAVAIARRALHRTSGRVQRSLKDGLPTLATVATTAPPIGLLGTVNGHLECLRRWGHGKIHLDALDYGRS